MRGERPDIAMEGNMRFLENQEDYCGVQVLERR
jgi:hypothetical protein